MSIQSKYITSLELDKVLAKLANETTCEAARLRALRLTPVTTEEEAVRLMAYTADANRLTNRYGTPTAQNVRDCTGSLERARLGAQLPIPELLSILHLLETIRRMIGWKKQSEEEVTALDYLFSCLTSFKSLEDELKGAILDEETLSDSASPALAEIRRKIRNNQQKVRSQLDNMIRSSSYQKYLQDSIVTMRDGRYVVPVKAEYRSEVKGLVHDTSSSGATVFIEPMSVVEANNEIKVLESQEKKEIDRILYELSASVGSYAEAISRSYEVLVELDLYFAKSRLADKMKASVPQITGDRKIKLIRARHPLIDPEKIVPVDVTLGIDFDTLVITGPNTGGKTVLLKTVGLLTLMMMCGLMIPAADGSSLSVFDEVLSDIGDEQSIEQSLSTFSAHMTNIVSILEVAGDSSLVLLDELGSGTDPVEGAALAISIIEKLRERDCRIMATTHYPEIKLYALETRGVVNGSCEFDVETLRPTYRLLIGVPGRSNAFAISEKLGLDPEIIDSARERISSENQRFEDVVSELETARQNLEKEYTSDHMLNQEAERLRQENQAYRERLEKEKEAEIEKAREKARSIVEQVRYQADQLMNELEELKKQKDSANFSEKAAKMRQSYRSGIRKLYDSADPVTGREKEKQNHNRALKRGDIVIIPEFNKEGTVLTDEDKDGYVMVQAGIIKTKAPAADLRLVDRSDRKVTVNNQKVSFKRNTAASGGGRGSSGSGRSSTEVDVRGMTTDEAIMEVDRFLDSCVLSHIGTVTVIHGKGTGTLRAAIQQHLKRHPSVRSFRTGVYGEGENGVTIVELK